jgi:sulfoxide reductase heme-binding subunit YedZ
MGQNLKLKTAKAAIFAASLTPLACLAYFAYTDNLGANPIEVITHWTGD